MKKKYYGIQILRFFAASFVVIDHAAFNVINKWQNSDELYKYIWAFGKVGVIVFFGISGFIMVMTRYDAFGNWQNTKKFLSSRLLRILPIYAIATSLQYLNKLHSGGTYNIVNYIKSILFIPYLGEGGLYRPILAQGWTLDYEMFFYLIFGISLVFKRTTGLGFCFVFFILLAIGDEQNLTNNEIISFYINNILLYFICGMMASLIFMRYQFNTNSLIMIIFLVFIALSIMLIGKLYLQDIFYLILSLILVFFIVYISASYQPKSRGRLQSLVEALGDASYSTYLFHGFILGAIKFTLLYIGEYNYTHMFLFVFFAIIISNISGFISYKYVEFPFNRYLNKIFLK